MVWFKLFLVVSYRLIILKSKVQGRNARWTVSYMPGKCFSPRICLKGIGRTVDTGTRENLRTSSLNVLNNNNKDKHYTV